MYVKFVISNILDVDSSIMIIRSSDVPPQFIVKVLIKFDDKEHSISYGEFYSNCKKDLLICQLNKEDIKEGNAIVFTGDFNGGLKRINLENKKFIIQVGQSECVHVDVGAKETKEISLNIIDMTGKDSWFKYMKPKDCLWCGKTIASSDPYKKYCNKECENNDYYTEMDCVTCGNSFKYPKTQRARKYCNPACGENLDDSYINKVKFQIYKRDNFTCVYCGKSSIEDKIKLWIDHIHPQNKDADNSIDNLVTSCDDCNSSKTGDSLPEDVVIRIWKKTRELNIKFNYDYKDLKAKFDKIYPIKKKLNLNG